MYCSPLLVLQLQHMGKHFPLSLLTPYLNCSQLWNSVRLRTNMGCILAYIPSLLGVASVWAAVLQKGYLRDAYQGYFLHPQGQ